MQKCIKSEVEFYPESMTDPLVLSSSNKLIFCFLAVEKRSDGLLYDCGLAIFRTELCLLQKYGYPNDEAIMCYPLFSSNIGFDGYSISKVTNSSWIKELESLNKIRWPNTNFVDKYDHWVFPFKETTLEIIASSMTWELTFKPYEAVKIEMLDWIDNS